MPPQIGVADADDRLPCLRKKRGDRAAAGSVSGGPRSQARLVQQAAAAGNLGGGLERRSALASIPSAARSLRR